MDDVRKILIYDDMPVDAMRIKRELRKLPFTYEILMARNGKELRKILAEVDIDLILADYAVPGYSGLDALRFIRSNYPSILVIFVTGTLNNEELAAETILTGASAYILKQNLTKLPKAIMDVLHEQTLKDSSTSTRIVKQHKESQQKLNRNLSSLLERIHKGLNQMEGKIEGVDSFLKELDQFRQEIKERTDNNQEETTDSE